MMIKQHISICIVWMRRLPSCRASSSESSSTRLARGVNGISTATNPLPLPIIFSTSTRASFKLIPIDFRTFAAMPVPSPIRPNKICSVPTKLWPSLLASSCASIITLIAFSVKRSNMAFGTILEGFAFRTEVAAATFEWKSWPLWTKLSNALAPRKPEKVLTLIGGACKPHIIFTARFELPDRFERTLLSLETAEGKLVDCTKAPAMIATK
ncbi:hypothetical protein Hanom_Chr05g00458731 [Helianthus anomalus]